MRCGHSRLKISDIKDKQKDLEVSAGQRLFEEQVAAIKREGSSVTSRERLRLCLWEFIAYSMWEVNLSASVKAERASDRLEVFD